MGIVCHALLRVLANYDEGRLKMMRVRFAGVLLPGETVRAEIWSNGSFRARVVERNVVVVDDGGVTIATEPSVPERGPTREMCSAST